MKKRYSIRAKATPTVQDALDRAMKAIGIPLDKRQAVLNEAAGRTMHAGTESQVVWYAPQVFTGATRPWGQTAEQLSNPTATLVEHTLLTQGFRRTSKAISLVAGNR